MKKVLIIILNVLVFAIASTLLSRGQKSGDLIFKNNLFSSPSKSRI
ncbi:hypothetical protein [Peptoniphilus timonensis]|nr:hypothetical protein [Peptoniphilus timonensis]